VSVFDLEPVADSLTWYLASLHRFEVCADDVLVLPSHGRPFRGVHTRIAQLRAHHDERLSVVEAACRERPHSAAETVPVIFGREFDAHQMMFALGESLAHLHALWYAGRLRRELGGDGVVRFSAE
jgi:glyoxylase-like metal-dependent hydrolase (beta-lactamase superfamily II)